MERILLLRKQIDEIDEEILQLLKERVEISKLIGKYKQEHMFPIRDKRREEEKIKRVLAKASELGLNQDYVKEVYRKIMSMSVHAQLNADST